MQKKNFLLVTISFMIAFVVATAMLWTPQLMYDCNVESFQPICTFLPADVDILANCTIDDKGSLVVTDADPNFTIKNISDPGRILMITFKESLSKETEIEVFRNEGYGFNEVQKSKKIVVAGSDYVYFVFPNTSYTDVRVDIGIDCQIDNIQLGNEGLIETNATNNPYWFIEGFIFATIIAVASWIVEKRKCVVDKFINYTKENRKYIFRMFILFVILGVIAVAVSLFVCEVLNDIYFKSANGIYTFAVIASFTFLFLCGIACIWYYRKTLQQDFEKVFVIMTIVVGFSMIVCAPFAHLSWDTDSHYRLALDASFWGNAKITQSDYLVRLPAVDTLIKDTPEGNFNNMVMLSLGYNEVISSYENAEVSLAHLPSGVFIALGRLMRLPFIVIYAIGKIPNLLIYVALCYLGMKQLKDGKMIFAVIALFPTNLLIATNYSYDYWVTGFSLLGMAYFVGILQKMERKVTGRDALIISASFALACLPKLIYFPFLLIPFLMPQKRIENKKKYYAVIMLMLFALVGLFILESMVQTTSTGDSRGGSSVDPAGQLAYVFGNIWNYIFILVKFLFTEYLTITNMENYISHFAYLDVASGSAVFVLLMMIVFLFDKDKAYTKETRSDWINRIYSVLMYFGGAALIASALYVAFTPVGHPTILGCQARYMIPLLYPVLSLWSMNKIRPIISKYKLCWAVVIGCYGLLFYDVATIFLPSVACLG